MQLGAVAQLAIADPDECAGAMVEVEREVLAGHARRKIAMQRQLRRVGREAGEARAFRRVDNRVQADSDLRRYLEVERRRYALADTLDAADDGVAHCALVIAQRTA